MRRPERLYEVRFGHDEEDFAVQVRANTKTTAERRAWSKLRDARRDTYGDFFLLSVRYVPVGER